MNDKALLEAAAKAAGIELDYSIRSDGLAFYHSGRNALATADGEWFAPLTDDGDALRLAVKSNFTIKIQPNDIEIFDLFGECLISVGVDGDPNAVTRRAITRAAAGENK